MSDASVYVRSMAYNNAWSNHRLLRACAGLTGKQFEAQRTGISESEYATEFQTRNVQSGQGVEFGQ